jgi:HSP20 family molecular chaperone IbpA
MTQKRDVTTPEGGEVRQPESPPDAALYPPVDIYEDAEGIHLQADMPGVSRDRLTVQVDRDTLLIEGDAQIEMPEGMNALYADVRSTRFRRSFTLSSELKADAIDASLKDGVLSVRIPKREEAKPRRIEVRTR